MLMGTIIYNNKSHSLESFLMDLHTINDQLVEQKYIGEVTGNTLQFRRLSWFEFFVSKVFRWKPENLRRRAVGEALNQFLQVNDEYYSKLDSKTKIETLNKLRKFIPITFITAGLQASEEGTARVVENQIKIDHQATEYTHLLESCEAAQKELDKMQQRVDTGNTIKVTSLETNGSERTKLLGMRNESRFADLEMQCSDGQVYGHRNILSNFDFFTTSTFRKTNDKHQWIVQLNDFTTKTVNAFVTYEACLGLSQDWSFDDLGDLFRLGNTLHHEQLMIDVLTLLLKNVNQENEDVWMPFIIEDLLTVPFTAKWEYICCDLLPEKLRTCRLETQKTIFQALKDRGEDDPNVVSLLGYCYKNGIGIEKDIQEGIRLYRRGVELGHPIALMNLAFCYHQGLGVEADADQAFSFEQQAAAQHLTEAQFRVGRRYVHSGGTHIEEGLHFYRLAADKNHRYAIYNLGHYYDTVKNDYVKAIEYYRKAADLDVERAQHNLALCYRFGKGVEKNERKAFKLFKKAAEKGLNDALKSLANCYRNGLGVGVNIGEADRLDSLANSQG